jgi:predicted HD phosphohydrolase
MEHVKFSTMDAGDAEDYALLDKLERQHVEAEHATSVLAHLRLMSGSFGGYKIDRLQHALQTATRAEREGADEEWVFAALLHDMGDLLAPTNHSDFAAAIIRPYVRDEVWWAVKYHGLFQEYYFAHHLGRDRNRRDAYKDHPHYQACIDFCEKWDQASFDPDYDTEPLEHFEPQVRRMFARPPFADQTGP